MSDQFGVFLFLLWNLVQWVMWFSVLRHLFPSRLSKWGTVAIETLISAISISLCHFVISDYGAMRTGIALLSLCGPGILLHKGSLFRKTVACIAVFFSTICVETLFMFIMPDIVMVIAERHLTAPVVFLYYIEYIFLQALLLAIVYKGFRHWERKVSGQLTEKEGWLFFLFPVSQLVLLIGWYFNFITDLSTREVIITAIVSAFCAISDILLFRMISKTSENARLQAQNALLNEQIAVQSSYYKTLAQNYSDMSKMRHDISNHLYTIQILLQDDKKAEALHYAAELRQSELVRSVMSDCHNTVIDAFVRHKVGELSAEGIDITCRADMPAQMDILDTDIIIALGNILDNAAEACHQTEAPQIRLSVRYEDHLLRFEAENSCLHRQEGKKRRIPYLSRGLGSKILQSLAEKYNGSYHGYADGETYHTVLVLKEPPASQTR